MRNTLIIEESSLEILPPKFFKSFEAIAVSKKFGVPPQMQILDRNFHSKIVTSLKNEEEKRGRPDVVHFALLDATSTPLFQEGRLSVIIRTREGISIMVKSKTRPPRTLERFCGVMAKLISGRYGPTEEKLFIVGKDVSFSNLIDQIQPSNVIAFSSKGKIVNLSELVRETNRDKESTGHVAWIVGGFPIGDFGGKVIECSESVVSISSKALTAHVVIARLCYELEKLAQ